MASETVRIKPETHNKLREIAEREGEAMPAILEKAIEAYRRQKFLEDVNRAFDELHGDTKAWAQEQSERREWDAALGDGLEDD